MRLTLINLYSPETVARYLLSSYILKAYLGKIFHGRTDLTVQVQVLNFSCNADVSSICSSVIATSPDLVGYSCYTWNIKKNLAVLRELKSQSHFIHILGGPEITVTWIQAQPDPAIGDYYVIGSGERVLAILITYLGKEATPARRVPAGVAYWKKGGLCYEESTEGIADLDEIPSVYLTGTLEDELYERQQAYIETARGCTFRCNYCMYHKNLSSMSYHSLERVFQELDYLILEKEVWQLRIFDSDFAHEIERAKNIVRHLIKLKERDNVFLPWIYWEFNYFKIDEEFFALTAQLKKRTAILNCADVPPRDRPQLYSDMVKDYTVINCVGVQSFSKKALKAVNRPTINIERLKAFMEMANRYNVVLKLDFILGLPVETLDSYFAGMEFFLPYLKNTDHVLNIHRLQILPGCQLETLCEEYGVEYLKTAPHMVLSTRNFSREEITYASKLTAVLFRIVNSPLRPLFFNAHERTGLNFIALLEEVYRALCAEASLQNTGLVLEEFSDDIYWNDKIYREIPSRYLIDLLKSVGTKQNME